jgi:hypothetical protein
MLDKVRKVLMKGILGDQSGMDTLEYVTIAGSVLPEILAIFAFIRSVTLGGW